MLCLIEDLLYKFALGNHYHLTAHRHFYRVTTFLGFEQQQRRSTNFIPLLNTDIYRFFPEVGILDQIPS
jgi:hypothetical protein